MSFKDMLKQADQQNSQGADRQAPSKNQKPDEIARDIGRHADDGVRSDKFGQGTGKDTDWSDRSKAGVSSPGRNSQ